MKRISVVVGMVMMAAVALMISPAIGQQKSDGKDANFIKEAAQGGMAEVKLGETALTNASSEDVKRFAQRMVDDHSKANKELKTLADNKGVALSRELDPKTKQLYDKLTRLKGPEFDKEYMRHMLEDHEQDVANFKMASTSVQDPDLKAWVNKTLPTLDEHLKMAKDIHSKVEKKSP